MSLVFHSVVPQGHCSEGQCSRNKRVQKGRGGGEEGDKSKSLGEEVNSGAA